MTLTIKPYKYISSFVEDKLKKGTSIVELLTDYRTPCYVFKDTGEDYLDMIATNAGVTLSDGNLSSFIFDKPSSDEIYIIRYISGINKILRSPNAIVPINQCKQLPKPYFSQLSIDGNYHDILLEFENQGWEIIRTESNAEGWKKYALVLRELSEGHQENYKKIEQEALKFYNSISSL